jgi:hypothetical protein
VATTAYNKPLKFLLNAVVCRLSCGHKYLFAKAAMRVVYVRVRQADFGKVFEAMREWLDRKNCELEQFETAADDGSIIIEAQFAEDDLAELFRREFQGSYGD